MKVVPFFHSVSAGYCAQNKATYIQEYLHNIKTYTVITLTHAHCMCAYQVEVCMHTHMECIVLLCCMYFHYSVADCMWCLHNWTLPYHHNCSFH